MRPPGIRNFDGGAGRHASIMCRRKAGAGMEAARSCHLVSLARRCPPHEPEIPRDLRLGRAPEELPPHRGEAVQHPGFHFQPDRRAGGRTRRETVRPRLSRRDPDPGRRQGTGLRRAHDGHHARAEAVARHRRQHPGTDSHRRHGHGHPHLAEPVGGQGHGNLPGGGDRADGGHRAQPLRAVAEGLPGPDLPDRLAAPRVGAQPELGSYPLRWIVSTGSIYHRDYASLADLARSGW